MRRAERERAPFVVGWAAPASHWVPAWFAGLILGWAVGSLVGAIVWLGFAGAWLASGLVDVLWRRTHSPSEDAKWTPLARLFYRRVPPNSAGTQD